MRAERTQRHSSGHLRLDGTSRHAYTHRDHLEGPQVSKPKSVAPLVAVVMGSDSDLETVQACLTTLKDLGVAYEVRVISAHRTPDAAHEFAKRQRGG